MKRCCALILALAVLLLSCAAAETSSWPGQDSGRRKVVNCEDWISLRQGPFTSSERLAEIQRGEVVVNCREHSSFFIHCETADGADGYVLSEYLAGPSFRVRAASEGTEGTSILSDPAEFDGGWQVDFESLGLHVLCRRDYDAEMGGELLRASCFDEADGFVWGMSTESLGASELDTTDAFLGGNEATPLLLVNNADLGLAALDPATGAVLWTVDTAEIPLGASQARALAEDGTLYIGGYYGPHPVAISPFGRVLWQSDAGKSAVWLYQIEIADDELIASFDAPDGLGLGTVRIDRATGRVLEAKSIEP